MAAKVDSAAVQDGYQLYRHAFFFWGAGPTLEMPKRHALEVEDVGLREQLPVALPFTAGDRQNLFVAGVAAQRVVVPVV